MSLADVDPLMFVIDGLSHLPTDPAQIRSEHLDLLLAVVDGAGRHASEHDATSARLLEDMRSAPLETFGDVERRKALHRHEESLFLGLCLLDRYTRRALDALGIDLDAFTRVTTPHTPEEPA